MKISLDTNVFIAVKNREDGHEFCEQILDAVDEGKIEASVSTIVVAEVLVGFYINNEILEAERFANHILLRYKILPVTLEIADLAARIRKNGLRLPDAIVVATAINTESILITLDEEIRHPNVKIVDPKEFAVHL